MKCYFMIKNYINFYKKAQVDELDTKLKISK